MKEQYIRTAALIGECAVETLTTKRVAVFGLGGVGGYVCEALARSGVVQFTLVDNDEVAMSNLNRQIIATQETIGMKKTLAMAHRIRSIVPDADLELRDLFFLPETRDSFDFSRFDYVVDAVDTVSAKLALIECAKKAGVPIISSMGTGNKLNPGMFEVADIEKTSVCPLAKVMRRELKKRGIRNVKVVYSREEPQKSGMEDPRTPASIAFCPSVAGLMIASEVIKDLIKGEK